MKKYKIVCMSLVLTAFLSACTKEESSVSPSNSAEVIEPSTSALELPSAEISTETSISTDTSLTIETVTDTYNYNNDGILQIVFTSEIPKIVGFEQYAEQIAQEKEVRKQKLIDTIVENESNFPFTIDMNYFVSYNKSNILSIKRFYTTYAGGAHDVQEIVCDNFFADTKEKIQLDNLFTTSHYQPILLSFIKAEIVKNPTDYYEDYEYLIEEHFPYQSFVLTDKGLELIYPTYTLSSYAVGPSIFTIPYEEIKDIWAF